MKRTAFALALAALMVHAGAGDALAQLGGLNKALGKAQKAKEQLDKAKGYVVTDADERKVGEQISGQLIDWFGVYQDKEVTKYVSLVGTVLAQSSSRPNLQWEFIVLDTDGVNAYAAPGGLVHITRGALGLIKNEAELAGVLGHEITHVTARHTLRAIQQAAVTSLGTEFAADRTGGLGGDAIRELSGLGSKMLYEGKFSREDEQESDRIGIALANKIGYAPSGMISVLTKIAARNKEQKEPNGLFASHPQIKDRIAAIEKQIKTDKLNATALVEGRYAKAITLEARPVTDIATIAPGARGLTGGGSATSADKSASKADDKKKPEEKPAEPSKKGGSFGTSLLTKGSQSQNTGTIASAGSRGVSPDRDAVGGSNKSKVRVTISASELEAFKKGIA